MFIIDSGMTMLVSSSALALSVDDRPSPMLKMVEERYIALSKAPLFTVSASGGFSALTERKVTYEYGGVFPKDIILERLEYHDNQKILDLGAGNNQFLKGLKEEFRERVEILGIDAKANGGDCIQFNIEKLK